MTRTVTRTSGACPTAATVPVVISESHIIRVAYIRVAYLSESHIYPSRIYPSRLSESSGRLYDSDSRTGKIRPAAPVPAVYPSRVSESHFRVAFPSRIYIRVAYPSRISVWAECLRRASVRVAHAGVGRRAPRRRRRRPVAPGRNGTDLPLPFAAAVNVRTQEAIQVLAVCLHVCTQKT